MINARTKAASLLRLPVLSKKQAGQAMVEFTVFALFVMTPIFLMIPVLGKIADMNQKTVLASRYGAWERTISTPTSKSEATITNEARLRFFARNNKYIVTNEAVNEQNNERSYLWRSISNSYDPMLTKFSDVNSTIATNVSTSVRGGFVLADIGLNVVRPTSRDFNQTYDIYRSEMSLPVATNSRLKFLDKGIDCAGQNSTATFVCIKRQNAIYTDTWSAGSSGQVASRVQDMVLTSRERAIGTVLRNTLGRIPFGMFREVNWLDLGIVRPDVLPADRLGGLARYRNN